MKKIAIILSLIVVFASCNRKNKFHVEGELKGLGDTIVYLNKMKLSKSVTIDSTETNKSGEFSITGETEYPGFFQLALSKNSFINLLIKPGEDVYIKTNSPELYNYHVEGSPGSRKVQLLDRRLRNTKHKLDSLTRIYKREKALNATDEKLEKINEKYREVLNQQRDSSIAFIVENLSSMASIMALYQKINPQTYVLYKNSDLQYIKIVSDSLKEKYPGSEHVKALLANKEELMKRYKNLTVSRKLQNLSKNVDYNLPNISLPNMQGDTIALNRLNDKMILLSFWSAKDKASIQRNLELKKLYNRYHKKGFEIYQVSIDEDQEAWKNAVKFDQLPWINVNTPQGLNAYATRIYNVRGIPTDYLINKKNEIVSHNAEIYELRRQLSIALD